MVGNPEVEMNASLTSGLPVNQTWIAKATRTFFKEITPCGGLSSGLTSDKSSRETRRIWF